MNKLTAKAAFFGALLLFGCSEGRQETEQSSGWRFSKEIPLAGMAPVGIAAQGKFLWLSDVANNRMVKIDTEGNVIREFDGFERPMHFAIRDGKIYVPEYASDTIRILENDRISTYPLYEQADAISGVAVDGNTVAVADFYNHRIILQQGERTSIIGKEGHNDGELYYPTDLAIHNELIYVADAYNNRVQVFDFQGNYVKMIGWKEGINVATGLTVTGTQVIVADFESDRILVYDLDGKLLQTLPQYFNKPTDIEVLGKVMYVVNYNGGSISIFEAVSK